MTTTSSTAAAIAVPVGGDTRGSSMRASTTTRTSVQKDGGTTVTVEEVMADGSRNIRSVTYPPGVTPPSVAASGTQTTALPAAAASAARSAAPAPVSPSLGRSSVNHQCQFCGFMGRTYVKERLGTCSIIAIVVLVICFWPLFWLPLVMDSCKDKQHICSNCQRQVGEDEANCDTCCNDEH